MIFNKVRLALACAAASAVFLTAACGPGAPEGAAPATEGAGDLTVVDPATAATVVGKVFLDGEAPRQPVIRMSADPVCEKLHPDEPAHAEQVVKGEGGALRYAFAWIKAGLEGKQFAAKDEEARLDQIGCIYKPHVFAAQTGQKIRIHNGDPTTHNVHPLPRINREWNKSQTAGGADIVTDFVRQEILMPIKCNIHPWMRSYVSIVSHPFFAVTDEEGTFRIAGLPAGTYTLEIVHEKLGALEQSVTLAPSEEKGVEFRFSAD